jgi:hypothetical protein
MIPPRDNSSHNSAELVADLSREASVPLQTVPHAFVTREHAYGAPPVFD